MQRSAIVELEENALILEFATVGTFSRFCITLAATLFSSIPFVCARVAVYFTIGRCVGNSHGGALRSRGS
jgi:hypothetical protein|eukprot:COSAG01_NODE_820_length_13331_cov_12.238171_2_plen_70_part_00